RDSSESSDLWASAAGAGAEVNTWTSGMPAVLSRPRARRNRGPYFPGRSCVTRGPMKTWKTLAMVSIGAALLAPLSGCNRLRGGGASPTTEDEKTLYTLGMLLGRNLGNFNLTADELEMVKSGLSDMVLKRPHKVELETYGPKVDALARK